MSPGLVVNDANAAAFAAAGAPPPDLPQTTGTWNEPPGLRIRGEAQLKKTIALRIKQALHTLGEGARLLNQHGTVYANGVYNASSLSET